MKFYILTRLDQLTELAKETFIMTRQVHSKLDTVEAQQANIKAQLEAAAQRQEALEAEIAEVKALVLALPPGTTGSPELMDAVTRLTASTDQIAAHVGEIESAVADVTEAPAPEPTPTPNPASQG